MTLLRVLLGLAILLARLRRLVLLRRLLLVLLRRLLLSRGAAR
ncbi:MAG: hypothetical protein R2742_10955 [Micropruina glycogenica]